MADAPASCPKCGTTLVAAALAPGREAACARCGLLVARWTAFCPPEASPELDSAWRACEAAWEDASRHERLLEVALARGELEALVRRYRLRPGDPVATERLGRIVRMTEAAARAQVGPGLSGPAVTALRVLGYAAALAMLAALVWFVALALERARG